MTISEGAAACIEETIGIVGVGLIGGSIAAATKSRGLARTVIGVGRSLSRLEGARSRGLVDQVSDDLAATAAQATLLIFCTPVDRIIEGVREAADHCLPGTLITDAGSVKGPICFGLKEPLPAGVEFIGSHPIAGSEKQGFEAANGNLFQNRVCVVTPKKWSSVAARDRMRRFWQALGMQVIEMSPEAHDHALSETSHFPHLAAAALAATLSEAHRALAASGFRDTTRIAAGDPDLWTSILLQNGAEVLGSLDKYASTLDAFRQALANRDAASLKRLLEIGKTNRDGLSQ